MIDIFALALTHGLLALAAWRLTRRDDLDAEPQAGDKRTAGKRAAANGAPPHA